MRYILMMLCFVLAACGAPNLGALNLEPLLIQPGDLPAGISAAQVRAELPQMFEGVPTPIKAIDQRFQDGVGNAGGVTVALYEMTADRDTAYDQLVKGMTVDAKPYDNVGERAMALSLDLIIQAADVAFVRCHAVVYVRIVGSADIAGATSYAKRLDERLSENVC